MGNPTSRMGGNGACALYLTCESPEPPATAAIIAGLGDFRRLLVVEQEAHITGMGRCWRFSSRETLDVDRLRAQLDQLSEALCLDYFLLSDRPSLAPPALMVFDMDSTLIDCEVIDQLAIHAGVGEQVAAVTESAMRGELEFRDSLMARVALLKGLPSAALDRVRENLQLNPGVADLLAAADANNCRVAVASGGFTVFAEFLQGSLPIWKFAANRLQVSKGHLEGTLVEPIVDADFKARQLQQWAEELGLESARVVAVGDGANDLAMLAAAGLGVAFHGKPAVRRAADANIRFGTMNALRLVLGWH